MRTKAQSNGSKIKQCNHCKSAQVGGHGQIAVVEDTPVGADAIRQ